MFINPKTAIKDGWVSGITNPEKQVQPNAIDFTLDGIKSLAQGSSATVTEDGKTMRKLFDIDVNPDGNWHLKHSVVYDGTSDIYVELPEGIAAVLFTRSTLARNGVFLVSGLYDSGYKGHIGFTLYPVGGSINIAPGTRVGQIAFMSADSAKMYAGGYNHQAGTHYAEEAEAAPEPKATKKTAKTVEKESE